MSRNVRAAGRSAKTLVYVFSRRPGKGVTCHFPPENPTRDLFRWNHLQIVSHRKGARDAFGAQSGSVLVGLVIDNALQGHVTVIHDDTNWLLHAERVFLE